MGTEYRIVNIEQKEIASVTCDKCGVVAQANPGHWNEFGEPYSRYHHAYVEKEFVYIEKVWGYYSKKDGERHSVVLCEACYDKIFDGVGKTVNKYANFDLEDFQ